MKTPAINTFLVSNGLRIASNPCVSPDACLDWAELAATLQAGAGVRMYPQSKFTTAAGAWELAEGMATGDVAWVLMPASGANVGEVLAEGVELSGGRVAFPATYANLLAMKNLVLEHDAGATIFPTAATALGRSTLGVGARMTTMHWPAVEWAMAQLGIGLTAN